MTLLTEMDDLHKLKGVLVLAVTNKPGALDPAIMRPGRFDSSPSANHDSSGGHHQYAYSFFATRRCIQSGLAG